VVKVSTLYVCAAKEYFPELYQIEIGKNETKLFSVNVHYKNSKFIFFKLYRYLKAHFIGLKVIEKERGKVKFVHLNVIFPAGIVALFFYWFRGLNFLITEHSTIFLKSRSSELGIIHRSLAKLCLKKAELLTTVTFNLGNDLGIIQKPKRLEKLNNVADEHIFFPTRTKYQNEKFRFIHISTLVPEHKNPKGLLNAFASISVQRSDFEVVIISDGEIIPIKNYAEEIGLGEFVKFFPTMAKEEVANEFRKSNCLVLFSNYENMPVVISEAWMCGLPVISTNVGGISESLTKENGILIQKGDEIGLANAIVQMLDFPTLFDAKNISSIGRDNFSYHSVSETLAALYRSIP
jgi:glycosyltransferase involved in cell wall biosynthesis